MKRYGLLLWMAGMFVLWVPTAIWLRQTGSLTVYFDGSAPPGQLAYVLSKWVGMLSLSLIAAQLIFSLCHRLQCGQIYWLGPTHYWLGATIVLLATGHLLLFFAATSLRQGEWAFGILLPDFRDFYHTHLSLGLFGLWSLVSVAVIGWWRRKRHSYGLIRAHRLYWVAIVFIYLHALAVGSESQTYTGLLFYGALGAIALSLGGWLFIRHISRTKAGLA